MLLQDLLLILPVRTGVNLNKTIFSHVFGFTAFAFHTKSHTKTRCKMILLVQIGLEMSVTAQSWLTTSDIITIGV